MYTRIYEPTVTTMTYEDAHVSEQDQTMFLNETLQLNNSKLWSRTSRLNSKIAASELAEKIEEHYASSYEHQFRTMLKDAIETPDYTEVVKMTEKVKDDDKARQRDKIAMTLVDEMPKHIEKSI